MEFHKRTLVKAITWELSGIVVLSFINYCVFGEAWNSAGAALGYGVIRIFMYYLHERLWKKSSWAKNPQNGG